MRPRLPRFRYHLGQRHLRRSSPAFARDQAPAAREVLGSVGLTARVVRYEDLDATAVVGSLVGRVGA